MMPETVLFVPPFGMGGAVVVRASVRRVTINEAECPLALSRCVRGSTIDHVPN
jgi:hypothetical protein